jgi:aerobic carbon-monoxide dehydrogenase large subunit
MTIHPGSLKKFGIGQPIRRLEDRRLITGAGQYTDDILPLKTSYAHFLRSPHAHAKFRITDVEAAKAMKGVRAVYTGADVRDMPGVACQAPLQRADGSTMPTPKQPLLCDGVAMHLGDAVAMVVADTLAQAKDAAEAIAIDWAPLPDDGRRRAEGEGRRRLARRARQRRLRPVARQQGEDRRRVRQGAQDRDADRGQ